MSDRITIKDIAKALNIHHSTVSRALRNDSRVKEDTRKTVIAYANEYGYQTNMSALELRGEKRKTVAVIVPNISHHFFSNIVSYFTDLASNKDFVVSVFQTNESLEREKNIVDTIIQNNFSAVVASISMQSKNTDHFNKLTERSIPLVMYDRVGDNDGISKITIDNSGILQDAISLLANKGYEKIAHITGPDHLNVFNDRKKGYQKALKENKLKYNKTISFTSGFSIEDGIRVAENLFDNSETPDAIISDSSNLLYGIIKEIKRRGLSVPDDIAIIVFGENPSLEVMNPSITSIVQPCQEIARNIFKVIEKSIDDNTVVNSKSIILDAEIIVRESI